MQYLEIKPSTTLSQLSSLVGSRNVDSVLATNDLTRTPRIGKQLEDKCKKIERESDSVTWQQKMSILNTMTSDGDLFEEAATLSENSWKILAKLGTFPDRVKIPETITLPDSTSIIGGKDRPVDPTIYSNVMKDLKKNHIIDFSIFNRYGSSKSGVTSKGLPGGAFDTSGITGSSRNSFQSTFNGFNIPWGKIQLYSSLADDVVDFPVYPEEIGDGSQANFTTMPDTIFQYEPWYVYESSGPREVEYVFHFHRDMWTGNHLDGKANQLVRFCEACCYPKFSGSSVNVSTVKMYINGSLHMSGIMLSAKPKWSGPIGQDGWYLECELTLTIAEVSEKAKNFDTVRALGIIGS